MRLPRAHRPAQPPRKEVGPAPAPTETPVETVPVDYPGHDLQILAQSKYERRWRANALRREPWTVAWMENEIRPGDAFYDIGANVGVFSLIGATLLRDSGVVVAVEPGYPSYARLCDNVALNRLSSMIVPVPLALSSSTGLQAFTYRSRDPGQSRHGFSATPWEPNDSADRKRYTQPMVAVTLDDAVSALGLPAPNLAKIDVDGAELHVLRGARQSFTEGACRSVFVEIDDLIDEDVVALLESYGFRLEERHRRKETSEVWHGVFRWAGA